MKQQLKAGALLACLVTAAAATNPWSKRDIHCERHETRKSDCHRTTFPIPCLN